MIDSTQARARLQGASTPLEARERSHVFSSMQYRSRRPAHRADLAARPPFADGHF